MDITAHIREWDMPLSSSPSLPSLYYFDSQHHEYDMRSLGRLDDDGLMESAIRSEVMRQVQERIRFADYKEIACVY